MRRLGMGIRVIHDTITIVSRYSVYRFCDNQYIAKKSSKDASQHLKKITQRELAGFKHLFTAYLKKNIDNC